MPPTLPGDPAISRQDRYRGCLLGLAIGDAVGAPVEFEPPGAFPPVRDMIGGGRWRVRPGEWTDDTSMALCLAASLVACGGMDAEDQMDRYLRWFRDGYMTPRDEPPPDIGNATRAALLHFEETGDPWAGSTDPRTAGNGSLMRLAAAPMFFARAPGEAIEAARAGSGTTHAAPEAVDACRYYAGLIVGALNGEARQTLLDSRYSPEAGMWDREPLADWIVRIADGSFKHKSPPEIKGTGYVVKSMEAALWAFHGSTSFDQGLLLAVNLGHDADTTGAVYGQLAGAHYGAKGIREEWRSKVAKRELIASLADQLLAASEARSQ